MAWHGEAQGVCRPLSWVLSDDSTQALNQTMDHIQANGFGVAVYWLFWKTVTIVGNDDSHGGVAFTGDADQDSSSLIVKGMASRIDDEFSDDESQILNITRRQRQVFSSKIDADAFGDEMRGPDGFQGFAQELQGINRPGWMFRIQAFLKRHDGKDPFGYTVHSHIQSRQPGMSGLQLHQSQNHGEVFGDQLVGGIDLAFSGIVMMAGTRQEIAAVSIPAGLAEGCFNAGSDLVGPMRFHEISGRSYGFSSF